MSGLLLLSIRHLLHNRVASIILIVCLSITIFLPLATTLLIDRYEHDLTARARSTPLVAGARGNRFDLTLAALYFRESELTPIPASTIETIAADNPGVVAPLHLRHTARTHPIVGTDPAYFTMRYLIPARGTLPLTLGDVVLGADVAATLELGPGDELFSDPIELYDIARPPALKMTVSGVLQQTDTPDDDAVFVDIKTAWILEGIVHGHDDVAEDELDDDLILGATDEVVIVSGAMIEYNAVTPENLASFHMHGDADDLPISAVLVFPNDDKAATLLKAKINATGEYQMVAPKTVIDDLLGFVFRIKSMLDVLSLLLAASTILMTALVMLLSARIRKPEMRTLHRIGCAPGTTAKLYAIELSVILATSIIFAIISAAAVSAFAPNLARVI